MMYAVRIFTVAALLCSATAIVAEPGEPPLGGLFQTENKQWRDIDRGISAGEYRNYSRQNLRVARKSAQKLLLQAYSAIGIPKQGAALTGAALGLVIEGAKFNLNESKTMTLRLDEVSGEDRAIALRFRLEW